MLDPRDNHLLESVRSRILRDPSGDYDDALFHSFLSSAGLGKEICNHHHYIEDNGKRYISASLSELPGGHWIPLRSFLFSFSSEYVEYDGFVMDGIIIEKDFIEEIISGIDESGVSAAIGDVLAEEAEAAVLPYTGDRIRTSIPAETPQNMIIELPVPPSSGTDEDRRLLASAFFALFNAIREYGIHSAVIPVFSGYSPDVFADIALSSVSAFLHRYPDYFIQIVFACRNDEELDALSCSDGEQT